MCRGLHSDGCGAGWVNSALRPGAMNEQTADCSDDDIRICCARHHCYSTIILLSLQLRGARLTGQRAHASESGGSARTFLRDE